MTTRTWTSLALAAGLGLTLAGLPHAAADDKKTEIAPAATLPDEAQQIALANSLTELGRKAKAPDLLVSAARILRRIKPTDGTEKAEVTGGTNEAGTKVDLKKLSDELLAEAKKMAPDNKTIADLAAWAEEHDLTFPPEPGKRGTFGGPKQYHHAPGAGAVITQHLRFRGGQRASISVSGNGRNTLTLRVSGNDGVNLVWTGHNPSLNWTPGGNAMYTVTVTNSGPGKCGYTLYHN